MAIDIELPHLGENIEEGQVVKILVNIGDRVEKNQNVLELETDKASIEIPVEATGTVKKIYAKEGKSIAVGQVFLTLDDVDNELVVKAPPKDPSRDHVQKIEDENDKTGIPKQSVISESVAESKKESAEGKIKFNQSNEKQPTIQTNTLVPASPSTRRFAREIGIDIANVPGSGPGGRISIEDVKAFNKQLNRGLGRIQSSSSTAVKPVPDFKKWGEIESKTLSNVRSKTAERLSYAWSVIPHVTQFDKADISDLEQQRQQFAYLAESVGTKLTVTAILLKIVVGALRKFPQFNASIDIVNNDIIYKKYYHIGVAVDTDRGLLVPVIRDIEKKSIIEICSELSQIAEKARKKKTSIEDMQGGTFTVSNLGGIGGTSFTPIVNWPEVAILGVARSNMEPLYRNGEFVPRLMLPLALSYDHRVIDGADGARFLRWIVQGLENPLAIALGG